jgi:hypothetical protein
VRGAPLKCTGILATDGVAFKNQCDCFVTKQWTMPWIGLKEVTKPFFHSRDLLADSVQCVIWGHFAVNLKEIGLNLDERPFEQGSALLLTAYCVVHSAVSS